MILVDLLTRKRTFGQMLLVHWFRSFKLKHCIWWMFGVFLYDLSFSSPWKVGWWITVVVAHIMKLPVTSVEWIMPLLEGARRWSFMPKCRRLFIPEAELFRMEFVSCSDISKRIQCEMQELQWILWECITSSVQESSGRLLKTKSFSKWQITF